MPLVAVRKSQQNEAVVDPWTVVHIGSGMAAGLTGMNPWLALGLAVGYEFVEQAFERSDAGKNLFNTSGPESTANAIMDVVVFMGAWYLGNRYNRTG